MYNDRIGAKSTGLCLGAVDENNVLLSTHLALNALCLHTKRLFSVLFEAKGVRA